MTKLEAKLVAAALVWHAVNAIKGRPLTQKQDKQLRRAAINLLTRQDDQLSTRNMAIADPAQEDVEVARRAADFSRRLTIYASALPSLGKTGTGRLVRRFLGRLVTAFELFDRSVELAHSRKKGRGPRQNVWAGGLGSPSPRTSSRAKRPSQKG